MIKLYRFGCAQNYSIGIISAHTQHRFSYPFMCARLILNHYFILWRQDRENVGKLFYCHISSLNVAGALRLELRHAVLETAVTYLYTTPRYTFTQYPAAATQTIPQ